MLQYISIMASRELLWKGCFMILSIFFMMTVKKKTHGFGDPWQWLGIIWSDMGGLGMKKNVPFLISTIERNTVMISNYSEHHLGQILAFTI
ncbi:hypothetical protein XELAEV_18025175mg [Xenopus laevis]|uniref:Uncharacterized protein n=1 Tax=Xenopus laevis TaxID=8355 RepID=A0A974D1Q1_XENLA|nr:hypothetical protein XELAEV_18025175mg [Xenopus laevis]